MFSMWWIAAKDQFGYLDKRLIIINGLTQFMMYCKPKRELKVNYLLYTKWVNIIDVDDWLIVVIVVSIAQANIRL